LGLTNCSTIGGFVSKSREFAGNFRRLATFGSSLRTQSDTTCLKANSEFNREFFDFRPFSAILAWNLWAISMACSEIPYETEQGIFFAEQGIFWSEQGISVKCRESLRRALRLPYRGCVENTGRLLAEETRSNVDSNVPWPAACRKAEQLSGPC
jgi:hypothetical protein